MKRTYLHSFILITLILWISGNYWYLLHKQLPIQTNKIYQITGTIDSMPVYKNHHLQFSMRLETLNNQSINGRVRLSWYGHSPFLYEGELWKLTAKLKPAQQEANFNHFNYSHWLLLHNFQAVGYVNAKANNQLVEHASKSNWHLRLNHWRKKIAYAIYTSLHKTYLAPMASLLSALTVGLKDKITQPQWIDFRNTGTSHLMAISGLHIGLCAAFAFFLMNRLWRLSEWLLQIMPAQKAGLVTAWLAALIYSLMAGFALPTQRAFIMISCLLLAKLLNRNVSLFRSLAIAFVLILVWDPMAITSASFWLSFCAVGLIAYGLQGRINPKHNLWWRHGRIQMVITIGLIPITLWFFQKTSFSALFANLVAIPTVSFIVVPLALLACLVLLVNHYLAGFIFKCAALVLWLLVLFLHQVAILPHFVWHYEISNFTTFVALMYATLLLLAPRGFPVRWLGIILLSAIFLNNILGQIQNL